MAGQSSFTPSELNLKNNSTPVFLDNGSGGVTADDLRENGVAWLYAEDHKPLARSWKLRDINGFMYQYLHIYPNTRKMHFMCTNRGL
jgi:hypothetical protein